MTEAEKKAQLAELQEKRRKLAETIQDADDEIVLAREDRYNALQFYQRLIAQGHLPELTQDVLDDFETYAWTECQYNMDIFDANAAGPSLTPGTPSWQWASRSAQLEYIHDLLTHAQSNIITWTRRLAAWTTQLAALDAQINALLAEIQKQLEAQRAAQEEAAPAPPAAPKPKPKPAPKPKPKPPPKPKPAEEKERTLEKIYGASKRSRQKK